MSKNMNKSTNEELDNYIDDLKRLYEVDPKRAIKEVYRFNINLRRIIFSKIPTEVEKRRNIIILIVLSVIILLEGFFTISTKGNIMIYYFGFVFFIAGHFVGMNERGFGIIFLFSHSVTGIGLMLFSLLGNIFNTPLITDLSANAYFYLALTFIIFIIATVYVILFNLIERIKYIKYSRFIPLILYIIGFAMAGLFSIIMKYI